MVGFISTRVSPLAGDLRVAQKRQRKARFLSFGVRFWRGNGNRAAVACGGIRDEICFDAVRWRTKRSGNPGPRRCACSPRRRGSARLLMDEILHHLETIVCWYLQEKHPSRVSEVVQDFVHPQYVDFHLLKNMLLFFLYCPAGVKGNRFQYWT